MPADFAIHENKLYVKAQESGINQTILWVDGLRRYIWKGDKYHYLLVDDVVEWYNREMRQSKNEENRKLVAIALRHFERAKKELMEGSNP